jgi:nucleotide-binding universal stress UspA family protein
MEGPTIDNILREAKEFKADLIILGSHKHGKFYHIIAGSIHDSIVSRAHVPVLIIPPNK